MIEESNLTDRLEGEHFLIYLDRLLKLKESKEIDIEKSEIYELVYGEKISSCEARKRLYNYRDMIAKAEEEGQSVGDIIETISSISNPKPENIIHLSEEEDNIQVIDMGDKFHIYNRKRSIVIDKEKVKKIKEVYCDKTPLTINELCRKLDIARRDFMLLKQGLSICHSDVPYLDEDIQDDNLGDLVVETLERRKEKYFLKLQQEEIKQMEIELSKYRKQDYLFDKIIEKLEPLEIIPTRYSVQINQDTPYREALLDLADLHLGEKVSNYWCEYSVEIARERFEKLTQETIKTCAELGVRTLHISNLGDDVTGIINDTLTREAEIPVEEQVELAVELIGKMLVDFSLVFDKVVYADVFGNHARVYANKKSDSENTNFEYFVSWGLKLKLQNYLDKIKFEKNVIDNTVIVKKICGVRIYEVHGDRDKMASVAPNLTMMIGKCQEIHTGHFHNNKSVEDHEVEVFQTRSFIGTNTYAKNIRVSAKAGQRLFIYEEGIRKYINDIVLN